jgi:nucleoside-diphosphate-sugar epimerase
LATNKYEEKTMIVVTGANGFIGQHLVPKLVKKFPGQKIIAAIGKSRKIHEQKGLLKLQKMSVDIVEIDLLIPRSLNKLPQSPDVLIHLASAVDTGLSDFKANDKGTENLMRVFSKNNNKSQVIYTSTAAVWAGRESFEPLTEQTPTQPNNEYGKTKLEGENILIQKSKAKGFGLTILRLNTVYGKDLRDDKLFGMVQKLVKQDSWIVRLNWPGKFGVVHVDDVVRSIIECLKMPSKPKEVRVFIVSTENVSLSRISQLIYRNLKKKYSPWLVPGSIWNILSKSRYLAPVFGKIFPAFFYNMVWRGLLVTNDVLNADGKTIQQVLPKWKRKKLQDHIKDVMI